MTALLDLIKNPICCTNKAKLPDLEKVFTESKVNTCSPITNNNRNLTRQTWVALVVIDMLVLCKLCYL